MRTDTVGVGGSIAIACCRDPCTTPNVGVGCVRTDTGVGAGRTPAFRADCRPCFFQVADDTGGFCVNGFQHCAGHIAGFVERLDVRVKDFF